MRSRTPQIVCEPLNYPSLISKLYSHLFIITHHHYIDETWSVVMLVRRPLLKRAPALALRWVVIRWGRTLPLGRTWFPIIIIWGDFGIKLVVSSWFDFRTESQEGKSRYRSHRRHELYFRRLLPLLIGSWIFFILVYHFSLVCWSCDAWFLWHGKGEASGL